ncbi:hypothetical protein [Planomonospora parontospora]|uniref:hypothetical protein n=1 Tax=Planomonospora parontospora TaxID=58119 RepID=UPI0016713853|nr:hypothetical protein [Planomonospora parontospora]GGL58633.1 hypothetical protein GCM10014719_70050 [Planomonospora parontospora subsp. antibiotica]GII17998.1 hypothetical protein Ppa05_47240 [Planomonospora parontospora subsp. antibiotica]
MTDPPPTAGTGSEPGRGATPRWVKVLGIIVGVLLLLAVIAMIVSGGDHGPGRHLPSGNVGGQAYLSDSAEPGVQQP